MRRISVSEAKAGMVLARPIVDQQGRVIVNAGTKLSQLYIARLERWGVQELHVEDDPVRRATAPALSAPEPEAAARLRTSGASEGSKAAAREPAPVAARALPPGVYRGADLAARIERTFSRVEDDPLMVALRGAVSRQLLAGGRDGG